MPKITFNNAFFCRVSLIRLEGYAFEYNYIVKADYAAQRQASVEPAK